MTTTEAPAGDRRRAFVEHVEAVAAGLYEHEMGSDWPVPYSALTVTQQEPWRGQAYCAGYALAICPVTKEPHPWFRSFCEPSCRAAGGGS